MQKIKDRKKELRKIQAFLGNYEIMSVARLAQPSDGRTDQPTDKVAHREVTLPLTRHVNLTYYQNDPYKSLFTLSGCCSWTLGDGMQGFRSPGTETDQN